MSGPQIPNIDAELFYESKNVLGEGILWDSTANVLRWVDIKTAEIHSLDLKTRVRTIDQYPDTTSIGAIALLKNGNGSELLGLTQHDVAILPVSTPTGQADTTTKQKIGKVIAKPLTDHFSTEGIDTRFNDGGCDPRGRLFAGSCNNTPQEPVRGEFFKVNPDGSSERIFKDIGCSNGLSWSPDTKTMYYIDSNVNQIRAYSYDVETGTMSNERIFAGPPQPPTPGKEVKGVYDGMTIDGVGNVWAARWCDSRVIGFRPSGEVIANILVPQCKSPTIPCFGGENLETMFIASAHSKWAREGEIQDQFPHSGDVFKVDFGPGSPIRKILGDGWKGAERHRFG